MDKWWTIRLVGYFRCEPQVEGSDSFGRATGNFVEGKGCFWEVDRRAVSSGLDPMALSAEVYTSRGQSQQIEVQFDVLAGGVTGPHDDPTFSFGTRPAISEALRAELPDGIFIRLKHLS